MKVSYLLVVSLLVVGLLCIPAVSAEEYSGRIYDAKSQFEDVSLLNTTGTGTHPSDWRLRYDPAIPSQLPTDIHIFDTLITCHPQPYADTFAAIPLQREYFGEVKDGSTKIADVRMEVIKNEFHPPAYGGFTIILWFDNWNTEYLESLTTVKTFTFAFTDLPTYTTSMHFVTVSSAPAHLGMYLHAKDGVRLLPVSRVNLMQYYYPPTYFEQEYTINIDELGTTIFIKRNFEQQNPSKLRVISDGSVIYESTTYDILDRTYYFSGRYLTVDIITPTDTYRILEGGRDPGTLPDEVILRQGTVTMTDHNGTTLSGFDVRAVNAYTGEEYTTSTETDVAVITLPMDRTISLRNPQTGQYEDVPVGYYKFYGYKSGYKMTNEDGIRISVLPEEYQGSYQLCDIIVTSEDGYLTGKHQFQIRSRADNRILQTGTISAQSATTNEWYNASVIDGIATLILPYDTSDAISPYVGNYYVYATSPGYIPSEYGTQISVRPNTQSEIRTILLTPIGGIPEFGNVTLRIQVLSDSGQGIPNAEILIDGIDGAGWEVWDTYTTSSTGYLEVSVYENSTYDIIVYATGYYDSGTRIEVGDTDPQLIEFKLYPTTPTPAPTTQPTGWITPPPTTQPTGIPDEDDDSEGFLMEAVRGIARVFGVGFATAKMILGMLLALSIGFATAKHLRGGAAEFGLGLLGGTMLGVLIGLLPIWTIVVLLLIVGMYVGYRYVGGSNNG